MSLTDVNREAAEALADRRFEDVPLADLLARGEVASPDEDEPLVATSLPFQPLGEYLLYAGGLGWLRWTGKRWEETSRESVTETVRKAVRALYQQYVTEVTTAKELAKAKPLLNASKVRAVTELLRGVLEADPETFDAHPDLFNVQNGVVDLRTGEITPHDPALRFTKIARGRYGVNTSHRDWIKTLEALPEDVRAYMQVRYGQALTGYITADDKLPIQQGGGRNAKSTLVNAVVNAAGDFAGFVPEDVLTAGPNSHPTGLMTLRGMRLAVIEELPEGRQLPVKRLKDLQGTQRITARFMRQDFVSFNATHSLFVNTNYVPKVNETDHGTWERLLLVRFPYTYVTPPEVILDRSKEREGDPGLRGRLERGDGNVWDAITFWLVQGAMAWYEAGRTLPPVPLEVAADTAAWRDEADLIMAYSRSRLTFDPSYSVAGTDLFADFSVWLKSHGHAEWSQETFANRFESHKMVERAKVGRSVTRNHAMISRHFGSGAVVDLPKQVRVWTGVRFTEES